MMRPLQLTYFSHFVHRQQKDKIQRVSYGLHTEMLQIVRKLHYVLTKIVRLLTTSTGIRQQYKVVTTNEH